MSHIDDLLRTLKESGGSDLHLSSGIAPRMRVSGGLKDIEGWQPLSDDDVRTLLRPIASDERWREYEETSDLDFAYGLEGVARFRANYFAQENGAAAVFRVIPEEILTTDQLGVPDAVAGLAELSKGLVVVTGPTGSGKSTTLAAVVDRINRSSSKHIVTIEDPVEYQLRGVNQVHIRPQIGLTFANGLRSIVRQDPDVIMIGEIRDSETADVAIQSASLTLSQSRRMSAHCYSEWQQVSTQ